MAVYHKNLNKQKQKQSVEKARRLREKRLRPQPDIPVGSEQERAYLSRLESQIMQANEDYVDYTSKHQEFLTEQDTALVRMQQMRHMMMFRACVEPLSQGINGDSILQVVGMYVGCALFDKAFSKDVHKGVAGVLRPYVEAMAENAGPDSKWAKRLDTVKRAQNDGRMPFDAETAALTQIGFMRRAYNDMRQPGADVNNVMNQYDDAVHTLRNIAKKDGVAEEDMNQQIRFMVGKMVEQDPNNLMYFNETVYSDVSMDEYKLDTIPVMQDDGVVRYEERLVWSGEFSNADGSPYTGGFSPRVPYSVDAYEDAMCRFYQREFTTVAGDVQDERLEPAFQSCCDSIYEYQDSGMEEIARKLKSKEITKGEASRMERDVQSLKSFDMGAGDLRDDARALIFASAREHVANYSKSSIWHRTQSSIKAMAMQQDGLSDEQVSSVMNLSVGSAVMDAYENCAHQVIDASIDTVLQADRDRTKVHSKTTGRGHEFDGMFDEKDMDSSYEYV